jgi:hypothetical protein
MTTGHRRMTARSHRQVSDMRNMKEASDARADAVQAILKRRGKRRQDMSVREASPLPSRHL